MGGRIYTVQETACQRRDSELVPHFRSYQNTAAAAVQQEVGEPYAFNVHGYDDVLLAASGAKRCAPEAEGNRLAAEQ